MTEEEARLEAEALDYARDNKKVIAKRVCDPATYAPEAHPVSVFMAGSPGAGKTEASVELLGQFAQPVIRIDADELRSECPGYTGGNAWLFHKAVSVIVDKIHDVALEQKQSFLLDATFSNFERAVRNIERSLGKKRTVQILYVYQEPSLAWRFVQAREATEGRRVPPEQFIEQYFNARDVVNRIKQKFGASVQVDLLLKNIDNSNRASHFNVQSIDPHIPERYGRAEVERIARGGL